MSKLNEIINGWANVVKDKIGTLDPKLKLMAVNRLILCNSCHMRVENTCSTKKVGINEITKKETNGTLQNCLVFVLNQPNTKE